MRTNGRKMHGVLTRETFKMPEHVGVCACLPVINMKYQSFAPL